MSRNIILIVVLGLFWSSCTEYKQCRNDLSTLYMKVRFYSKKNFSPIKKATSASTDAFSGVFMQTADSFRIDLPLDPNRDSMTYTLTNGTRNFILGIRYSTQVSIFNPDCPPATNISILRVLTNTSGFDSVAIAKKGLKTNDSTHVAVYF